MTESTLVSITPSSQSEEKQILWKRIGAALFYGVSSLLIMLINKEILTVQAFPSPLILGAGQMLATIIILTIAKMTSLVSFPDLHKDVIKKIFPLPLIFLLNNLCGLASTQELSLPMLTVLRRFSILFTMILEFVILKKIPVPLVKLSVFLTLFGSFVAASNDLSFNGKGYVFILLNDVATAAYSVVTKIKLNSKDLGKYGLIYYNSLFMLFPTLILIGTLTEDFETVRVFPGWHQFSFLLSFGLSCVFGFVLMFSTTLCTQMNSALDTTIIGCLKNIITTYIGMFFGGDYVFSVVNFIGLNISIVGSLMYTKVSFSSPEK